MKQFSATDIKVDNLSIDGHIDKLKLAAIEQTKSDTAVDVFVYDTSLDSDGGAWRKRTSHTSWYNETLNTAARGGRREFPAVAVIIAEANKVTIYDGDDPDLSMWMVFNIWGLGSIPKTCCVALNGKIVVGSSGWGVPQADFIKDTIDHQWNSHAKTPLTGGIVNRNIDSRAGASYDQLIVNDNVNDVAMTVLPDAPIDTDTGLPVPTIAVATDGGISVIKHDGTVVNARANYNTAPTKSVMFDDKNRLVATLTLHDNLRFFVDYTSPDFAAFEYWYGSPYHGGAVPLTLGHNSTYTAVADQDAYGNVLGLTKHDISARGEETNFCYITSDYNTGWMPGDIKLAILSDTTVEEDIGIDESTEKVVNGTFSGTIENGDFTEWNIPDGYSVTDNDLHYTGTGAQYAKPRQSLTGLVVGQQYKVSFDVTSISHHNIWVVTHETGAVTGHHGGLLVTKPGHYEYNFVAATENDWIVVQNNIDSQTFRIDNISIKPSGELITNGTFDNNTDVNGWVSANNATLSNTDDNLRIDKTDLTYFGARQQFPTVTGKRYKVCYELIESDSVDGVNGAYFQISGINIPGSTNQPYNTDVRDLYPSSTGSYSYEFVALSDTSEVRASVGSSGTYAVWDNISVRLAVEDRSVNNNGLQVFGEITKTAVAPGAELQSFLGFSENNYFMQPYNDDLDFGTGDFYISGWFKTQTGSGFDDLLSIGLLGEQDYANWFHGGILVQLKVDSNQLLTYLSKPTYPHTSLPQPSYTPDTWNQFMIVRRDGYVTQHLNGKQFGDPVEYGFDFKRSTDPRWRLKIGYSGHNYQYPADNSRIALYKISATAPTPEQIEKIYHDEKMLFQPGAKCTLDGTSDAVTALAHDSVTDLLHVGTSSGTSVFSGLRRVTSDTEPVTTCIDAQDELVVKR